MKKVIYFLCLTAVLAGCGKSTQDEGRIKDAHEDEAVDENAVHLKPEYVDMIGLETAGAEMKPMVIAVEIVGQIASETEHVEHYSAPGEGVLQHFFVALGETVDEGTPLFEMRLKTGETAAVKSIGHGVVLARYLGVGDRVDTLTSVITIADPDLLRASFDVYERDIGKIEVGQEVIVKSSAWPEEAFKGHIVYVSPRVDEKTRTIKIRANVENEEHLLKFGMFVTGIVHAPRKERGLMVPAAAVQEFEGRKVVFIPEQDEPGEYHIAEVKTGKTVQGHTEILEGLKVGDEVVTKGSFYLKSEVLKAGFDAHGHAH